MSREPACLCLFTPNNVSLIPQSPNSFQGPDLSNDSPTTPPWGLSLVPPKSPEIGMILCYSVEISLSKADENRCIEQFPSRTPCLGFHPFLQESAFNCQTIRRNISNIDNLCRKAPTLAAPNLFSTTPADMSPGLPGAAAGGGVSIEEQ